MLGRDVSFGRRDPAKASFDPVLAAIAHIRDGNVDEACWLTFLGVQFGKHRIDGWALCRAVYGRLGAGPISYWIRTAHDACDLCDWIESRASEIRNGPPPRRFGNHRKYESLIDKGSRGTPVTIKSYVAWVKAAGSHDALFRRVIAECNGDRYQAFHRLYQSMDAVASFGRLAKFDYLSMIGKLKIADIGAGSTYLGSSTGPMKGARMLLHQLGEKPPHVKAMEHRLRELGEHLDVTMQDLEDAICNWQKSPDCYVPYRG
jgi:hypothetical protein